MKQVINYSDKILYLLLLTLIFIFPFSIGVRNSLMGIIFLLLIFKILLEKKFDLKNSEIDIYIGLFLFFSLLSFLVANDLSLAWDRFLSPIFMYVFLFYVLIIYLEKNKISFYFKLFLFGNLSYFLLAFLFGFVNNQNILIGNGTGTLAALNVILFLSILFVKKFNNNYKIISFIGFVLSLFILFNTSSRGAAISFFCAIIIFSGFLVFYNLTSIKWKVVIIFSLIILIIISIFIMPDRLLNKFNNLNDIDSHGSLKTRVVMWNASIHMIKENPILGIGVGNFQSNFVNYVDNVSPHTISQSERNQDHPHNLFLFIAVEQGLISLIIFILILFKVIKISLINILSNDRFTLENIFGITQISFLTVFIIHSLVDSTARYGHVGFYMIIFFVLNYLLYKEMSDKIEN